MKDVPRGNKQLMRSMNTCRVLDAIRNTDSVAQVDLVRQTRLSVGTIVRIVTDLKRRGLIEEIGPARTARVGRKPTQLRLNCSSLYVIGAELAPDETTVALLDLGRNIVAQDRYGNRPDESPTHFVQAFTTRLTKLLKQKRIAKRKIGGIGLSVHGASDFNTGTLRYSKHRGWRDVPLKDMIERRLRCDVFVETEARTLALAEHRYGAGERVANMLLVEIDAGVGMAAIIDGQLQRGGHGLAGELGQNSFGLRRPGAKGHACLEDVTSGKAIVEQARTIKSLDVSGARSLRLALRTLFDAAENGNTRIKRIVDTAGKHLGMAIAGMINAYDPDRVVLAGSAISESRGRLTAVIRKEVMKHIWDDVDRSVAIESARLGERAAVMGAATLVSDQLFSVGGAIATPS